MNRNSKIYIFARKVWRFTKYFYYLLDSNNEGQAFSNITGYPVVVTSNSRIDVEACPQGGPPPMTI